MGVSGISSTNQEFGAYGFRCCIFRGFIFDFVLQHQRVPVLNNLHTAPPNFYSIIMLSFIHPFIHASIRPSFHPSIHPSIHSFIHSFIHLLTHSVLGHLGCISMKLHPGSVVGRLAAQQCGFPRIRGTILVVPVIILIVFGGLYWGPVI